MDTYRVQKERYSYYVQPSAVKRYADDGWQIFKKVEVEVEDIDAEVEAINEIQSQMAGGSSEI